MNEGQIDFLGGPAFKLAAERGGAGRGFSEDQHPGCVGIEAMDRFGDELGKSMREQADHGIAIESSTRMNGERG